MAGYDLELKQLVEQFKDMPSADRKAIMRKIPPMQRTRLKKMIAGKDAQLVAAPAVYEETNIKTLDQNDFSEWLSASLEEHKRLEMWGLRKDFTVTPRTARTLSLLLGQNAQSGSKELEIADSTATSAAISNTASPSLIDKMGGLFVKKPVQS